MPELPEVETIKNDLKKAILGKKIAGVEVRDKKAVKSKLPDFLKVLKGNEFKDISRTGKLLVFEFKNKKYLLIHLKMTGQLVYVKTTKPHPTPFLHKERGPNKRRGGVITGRHPFPEAADHPTKFTRAIFKFTDESELYFNDMRRFGYLKIADGDELKKIKGEYGIDPLGRDFKYKSFRNIFLSKKIGVKQVLMNQKLIAGIGNIYADEILFAARIRPTRPANSLKDGEIKKIFFVIPPILKKAIKYRGTSFSDYVDGRGEKGNFTSFLKIYGKKAGEKCSVCGGPVKAVKIGGRTAKFCPKCQK